MEKRMIACFFLNEGIPDPGQFGSGDSWSNGCDVEVGWTGNGTAEAISNNHHKSKENWNKARLNWIYESIKSWQNMTKNSQISNN